MTGPRPSGPVAPFFALAFLITWALQVPPVMAQQGWLPGDPTAYLPLAMLGVLGPLAAATFLTARADGRAGVRALYRSLFAWRVRWSWYAVALVVPGLLLTLALGALTLAGYEGDALLIPDVGRLLGVPIIAVGEEVGWRGYALPRLQRRHGPFAASVIIGVLWTLWHVPMLLGLGVPMSTLPVMLLMFVGGSLYFTWIYNRSGGSLLLAVLAHAGAHLVNSQLALPGDTLPLLVHAIVYALIGLGAACVDRRAFGRVLPPARRWLLARRRA